MRVERLGEGWRGNGGEWVGERGFFEKVGGGGGGMDGQGGNGRAMC
jgi:hypothetical protein